MKVTMIAEGTLTSGGITYVSGKTIDVSASVAKYLKNTFPNSFIFEEAKEKKIVDSTKDIASKTRRSRTSKVSKTKEA